MCRGVIGAAIELKPKLTLCQVPHPQDFCPYLHHRLLLLTTCTALDRIHNFKVKMVDSRGS